MMGHNFYSTLYNSSAAAWSSYQHKQVPSSTSPSSITPTSAVSVSVPSDSPSSYDYSNSNHSPKTAEENSIKTEDHTSQQQQQAQIAVDSKSDSYSEAGQHSPTSSVTPDAILSNNNNNIYSDKSVVGLYDPASTTSVSSASSIASSSSSSTAYPYFTSASASSADLSSPLYGSYSTTGLISTKSQAIKQKQKSKSNSGTFYFIDFIIILKVIIIHNNFNYRWERMCELWRYFYPTLEERWQWTLSLQRLWPLLQDERTEQATDQTKEKAGKSVSKQ